MRSEFETAIAQINAEKGISKADVMSTVEAALISAYRRNFGGAGDVRIELGNNDFRVFTKKTVVEEMSDPTAEMTLDEARQADPVAQVGDTIEVNTTPHDFGRIAAQTAKQVLLQRLREAERDKVFEEFAEYEGEILFGSIQRIDPRGVVLDIGKIEAVMPPSEQAPGERYRVGQHLKVYLYELVKTHKGPQALVSRTHRNLVRKLFEREVPEIFQGVVEIKGIAREPGSRSKMAVASRQEGLDPVGACVGMRGARITNVINELHGEKIDIVQWDADDTVYVANALKPAVTLNVTLNEADRTATVIVPERQLSLAIGRDGQNARLAARLTGWRVDIKPAASEGSSDEGPVPALSLAGEPARAATSGAPAASAAARKRGKPGKKRERDSGDGEEW